MKLKTIALFIVFMTLVSLLSAQTGSAATLSEPSKPKVNLTFDAEKERKIKEISVLPISDAFEVLREIEFLIDPDLSHKAIYVAMRNRKAAAVVHAMEQLGEPPFSMANGKLKSRNEDYLIARRIFEVFPEEAISHAIGLYLEANAVTKGNIVRAVGNVSAPGVKDILWSALEDTTEYEIGHPEAEGEPLRICDIAYNQLVLRYKIGDVLRTLGTGYRTAVRDYHINLLKQRYASTFSDNL